MTEGEAALVLAAIRTKAAHRTGWQPWMTAEVGYAALGKDWVRETERKDAGHGAPSTGWRQRKSAKEKS